MQIDFIHVKDFLSIRNHCLFCHEPMELFISNFMGHFKGVAALNVNCINDIFEISIRYDDGTIYLLATGFLELQTNLISFTIDNLSFHNINYLSNYHNNGICHKYFYDKILSIFEKLNLHLALKCTNPECKSNYILCSNLLTIINKPINSDNAQNLSFEVAPYKLYMESFVVNGSWLQNLWLENITCLYSLEKYDNSPTEVALVDWAQMDPNKIINKIKTLITFS